MLTPKGVRVLEYNVRFGDPETQVLLPMVADDLVPVLLASAKGEALPAKLNFHPGAAIVIVLAAGGYPDSYAKGDTITFPIDHSGALRNRARWHQARRGWHDHHKRWPRAGRQWTSA